MRKKETCWVGNPSGLFRFEGDCVWRRTMTLTLLLCNLRTLYTLDMKCQIERVMCQVVLGLEYQLVEARFRLGQVQAYRSAC
jgi:hypothetical protein